MILYKLYTYIIFGMDILLLKNIIKEEKTMSVQNWQQPEKCLASQC